MSVVYVPLRAVLFTFAPVQRLLCDGLVAGFAAPCLEYWRLTLGRQLPVKQGRDTPGAIGRLHSALSARTPADAYENAWLVYMMDKARALPTALQAQKPQQGITSKILTA